MKNFWILCVAFLFFVSSSSCRKSTLIGDELIPGSDYLYSSRTDTFTIITNTLFDDSANTIVNLFYALGSWESEDFGNTSANIYTQVGLPFNNLNFGANAILDSIVFTLDYVSLFGDSTSDHTIQIYRMLEDIDGSNSYDSESKLLHLHIPIGNKSFIPNYTDSIEVYGTKYEPHLRIKLDNWFANDFFDQSSDTTKFDDATLFQNYLKGLYIETDTSSGFGKSIMQFNIASSISGISVYYKNDDADSLVVNFPFNGLKFNAFTHNYSGTDALNYIESPNEIEGDAEMFVQGFAGLKSSIKIPYITNFQGVGINKAELVFTVLGTPDTLFQAPPALLLVRTDSTLENKYDFVDYSTERFFSITDQGFSDPLSYGGRLDTTLNSLGETIYQYKYNISLYMQDIISGVQENDGMMLTCYAGNRLPNGVVLCGSNYTDSTKRPFLSITYTLIDP